SVTGDSQIGGLVGSNNGGNISGSYASDTPVTGTRNDGTYDYVGGLVGINSGSITGAYAANKVTGNLAVGGLVGTNNGTISDSYWDTAVSGQASSAGGTGKTTAEMQQAATFAGWSITTAGGSSVTWRIYEGSTYPLFRTYLTPLTVTATGGSRVYDGTAYGIGVSYSALPDMSKVLGTAGYAGATKNVGSYTITPTGLYSTQQGYDISYASGTLSITPRALSVTATAASKLFDGLTTADVTYMDNRIAGDVLTINGSANFADKYPGVAKLVTVNGIALTGT
ncbi:MAG: YDG domain-containing protein, partial [Proteobacteria bacterium]|nr:YDG domain-containing protein [Pseudomonadota bacterium]